MNSGVGDLVAEVDLPNPPSQTSTPPATLADFASYNWLQASSPTIVNAYRVPTSPLSPLFVAVKQMQPDFEFKNLDIVTDRNNLRKLLRWAAGVADKDVRIDVEQVGQTLLFTRWESRSTDSAGSGYGHNFEVGMTKVAESCKGHGGRVTGHHRIVSFGFAGISMLVRFEVDACSANVDAAAATPPSDLADMLSGLSIKSNSAKSSSDGDIKVIPAGSLVPQQSIIELKTRSQQSTFDTTDAYPQLFFSQTPTLILARHTRGTFTSSSNILLSTMAVEQRAAQGGLAKLASALKQISSLVKGAKGSKFTLKIVGRDLRLYERLEGEALPESLMKKCFA
ncbi:hypothetical protein RQP46_004911 [Phenoliferia psychrophenolica]